MISTWSSSCLSPEMLSAVCRAKSEITKSFFSQSFFLSFLRLTMIRGASNLIFCRWWCQCSGNLKVRNLRVLTMTLIAALANRHCELPFSLCSNVNGWKARQRLLQCKELPAVPANLISPATLHSFGHKSQTLSNICH